MTRKFLIMFTFLAGFALQAGADDAPLFVYGPGGPAPAMKEAAEVFSRSHHARVEVTVRFATLASAMKAMSCIRPLHSGHASTSMGPPMSATPRASKIAAVRRRPLAFITSSR